LNEEGLYRSFVNYINNLYVYAIARLMYHSLQGLNDGDRLVRHAMLNTLDFYPRATPSVEARKSLDPWNGPEGDNARRLGVQTRQQFMVYRTIGADMARTGRRGTELSDSQISATAGLSNAEGAAALNFLLEQGLYRRVRDAMGRRAIVPALYL
jgi:hypothetical protein